MTRATKFHGLLIRKTYGLFPQTSPQKSLFCKSSRARPSAEDTRLRRGDKACLTIRRLDATANEQQEDQRQHSAVMAVLDVPPGFVAERAPVSVTENDRHLESEYWALVAGVVAVAVKPVALTLESDKV
jgi:hypothetical protein